MTEPQEEEGACAGDAIRPAFLLRMDYHEF